MTLDEIKGLSPAEAIKKVAEFAGVSPATVDGQWRVESSRGTHPTMTNPESSAKGHFAFIDKTHSTWEQRLGTKLDRFDFHDALFEYGHQMKENMQAAKGNEQDAVRMYYRGPDRTKWDAATEAYVGKVFNRTPEQARPELKNIWNVRGADVKAAYDDTPIPTPKAPLQLGTPRMDVLPLDSNTVVERGLVESSAAVFGAQDAKDNQRFWGLYDRETTLGASYSRTMQPTFNAWMHLGDNSPADPAHIKDIADNWPRYMMGLNNDEREMVAGTKNKEELANVQFRIQERRQNDLTLAKAGTLSTLGADLITGGVLDPTSWATGIAAAKAFALAGYGATVLAQAGRPGAAAISAAAENVVGNVAYEAAQQAMGEYKSVNDYALAAVTGLVPSIVSSPLAYREGMKNFKQGILENVARENLSVAREAVTNLGEGATPDAIRTEMSRIEAARIQERRSSLQAAPPEEDRINAPNLDEVEAAKPAADAEPGRTPLPVDREREASYMQAIAPGITGDQVRALPAGVHVLGTAKETPQFKYLAASLQTLADQFLPKGTRIALVQAGEQTINGKVQTPRGQAYAIGADANVIALRPGTTAETTGVHEFGHLVEKNLLKDAPPEVQAGVQAAFNDWARVYRARGKAQEALARRGPIERLSDNARFAEGERSLKDTVTVPGQPAFEPYYGSFPEFMAEQFGKYIEAGAQGVGPAANVTLSKTLIQYAKLLYNTLKSLFDKAKDEGLLRADSRVEAFFEGVRAAREAERTALEVGSTAPDAMAIPATFDRMEGVDPAFAQKYGLDLMPQKTPREQAEFRAVVDLYRKAEAWVARNPRDDARIKVIGNNSLINVALPATLLASSDNPVARMIAGTLLEQSTGAQGRRATAAIAKVMLEEKYIGNAVLDYDNAYRVWRNEMGGSVVEDHMQNKVRENFNRAVMVEREARLRNVETEAHPMVSRAADVMDAAYERARVDQVDVKTVGWARLPQNSRGYTPHNVAAKRLQEATAADLRVFTQALAEQFQEIEGFDAQFSAELARSYLDHARINANGGHEIPANIHNPQAASMVEGALAAMGMNREQVQALMGRYAAGGPSYTKRRLQLDLLKEYDNGEGGTTTLMQLFNTDQVSLLRSYARRASGEVALAQYGVMGAQGLTLLRRALDFGPTVTHDQRKAYDQVAAEMLDKPFGTAGAKWMDRVMTVNAAARLGGMGFTQLGESLNGFWHVGVGHTLSSIASVPRLRAEVAALSRGEKVSNGILGSMEVPGGGGEFGLEGYKMVTAFDSPEQAFTTYGHDATTWVDRVLRSASHVQGTLSMHRMIQAVQVRGMAEQITLKAIKYIRDGGESVALRDMGFTEDMVTRIKADLPSMVVYDAFGRVKEFDITKAKDTQAAAQFMQAVRRGTGQIIQRSYIGEQGKWAHDGLLRLLTQFRSYPLVAMEKQWARQRSNHGVFGAFGILLGSMAAVLPIYYARVAVNALNRPDREEYLERALDPIQVAKASLNYVGVAGMAGDLMDLLSNATGVGQADGGRAGASKSLVGSLIPGIGYVDDVYKAAVDPSDPHKWAQLMPFSRTPGLLPLINGLRDD